MILNLPNILTLMRILLIPIFMIVFYWPFKYNAWVCIGIFVLAAVTDWLDGRLARILGQTSKFGAFLDPVADKLMVIIVLILLVGKMATPWFTVPAALIIAREIMMSALREWMAKVGKSSQVAVIFIGTFKTFMQMAAIIAFLYYPINPEMWVAIVAYCLLYFSLALTFWSLLVYGYSSWSSFTKKS